MREKIMPLSEEREEKHISLAIVYHTQDLKYMLRRRDKFSNNHIV